jgi:hypothetical protein
MDSKHPLSQANIITLLGVESLPQGDREELLETATQLVETRVLARARVTKFNNIGVSPTNPPLSVYEHKIEVWGYNIDCVKLQDHFYFVNNGPQSPYARFLVERSLTYTYQTEQ